MFRCLLRTLSAVFSKLFQVLFLKCSFLSEGYFHIGRILIIFLIRKFSSSKVLPYRYRTDIIILIAIYSAFIFFLFQEFDASGREELLNPGIYNLVRSKMIYEKWISKWNLKQTNAATKIRFWAFKTYKCFRNWKSVMQLKELRSLKYIAQKRTYWRAVSQGDQKGILGKKRVKVELIKCSFKHTPLNYCLEWEAHQKITHLEKVTKIPV